MKIKYLNPNQIITLNDFPVHNEHILKIFFRIFKEGHENILPPCPIMHKRLVISAFDEKLKNRFKEFEERHKKAEYFLLDGSHKTTAASLTGNNIKVMVFERDEDIIEAERLAEAGELFNFNLPETIEKNAVVLKKHFIKKKVFQTVEEKTNRMVKEKVIPSYMIKHYKNLK